VPQVHQERWLLNVNLACGCVAGCDEDSDSDLTEWLSSIGVDSDVADIVRFVQFEFSYDCSLIVVAVVTCS